MNQSMRNFACRAVCAVAAVFVGAGGSLAPQFAAAQEAAELEEVIVTAQRREESLQDVPLAITVLNAAELERRQVHNVLDLQASVPNISISRNTGTPSAARIFLRGIGEDESRATVEPAISLYVDGVYIGRQVGALVDLFDVEQIEVLRGPQGTLYGRNSNGGAVRITTRKPSYDETFLTWKSTFGDNNRIDTQLSANMSQSEDFAFSFSVLTKTRDGLFHTDTDDDIGTWDNFAGRLGVRWQAGEATEMLLRYDLANDDSNPLPPNQVSADNDIGDLDDDVFQLTGAAATGDYDSEVDSKGLSLTVDHDLGNGLQMQSLTAWRSLEDELNSVILASYNQKTDQSQVSQEIQISSDWDGDFNYVAGVFWFDEDIDLDYTFFGNSFGLEVETRAWAVFGQGTWHLISDQLWLTAGVRYTDEEKDFKGTNLTTSAGREETEEWDNLSYKAALNYRLQENMTLYGSWSTGFKSGAWSPDGLSFYPAEFAFLPVDEEKVETAEIGLRSELLNNRLRLNATYFFNTYEDLQFGGTTERGFTRFNVPEAEIQGVEIEINANPLPGLNVSLAAAWLDAEYTDVDISGAQGVTGRSLSGEVNADIISQVDDDASITEQNIVDEVFRADDATRDPMINRNTPTLTWLTANESGAVNSAKVTLGDAAGYRDAPTQRLTADIIKDAENNDLKNAPESSIKIAATYTYPLNGGLEFEISGEYIYEEESFTNVANVELVKRDETDLINMRVGLRSEQWELFLWGKNLTDEIYALTGTASEAQGNYQVYAGDPMTWGLDFKLHFGR